MLYGVYDAERVVCYPSHQLQLAERNYPVYDKELLAMKYALAKFKVYLLDNRPCIVYTDHTSLRPVVNSPYLSPRMARLLSFFAESIFAVEYNQGRLNFVDDALSRRLYFEPATQPDTGMTNDAVLTSSVPLETLLEAIRKAYYLEIVSMMNRLLQAS